MTATPMPDTEEPSQDESAAESTDLLLVGDVHDGPSVTLEVQEMRITEDYDGPVTGLKVRSCNVTDEPLTLTSEIWIAMDADGGRYSPYPSPRELSPEYPYSMYEPMAEVDAGDCLVGWITYQATDLSTVRYRSTINGSATWDLRTG